MRAPLDPAIATMLEATTSPETRPVHELPVEESRAVYELVGHLCARPPSVTVEDVTIPGPSGTLAARVYRPEPQDTGSRRPGLVYLHGGGWTIGSLDTHDGLCGLIGEVAGCTVISVDYRLAPEHPHPAAIDDCDAATLWVVENAGELGIDPQRLAVGGDSAGGNLATVIALRARDRGSPALAAQLLLYACVDSSCDRPSMTENATGPFLETETMRWFSRNYAGDAALGHPEISPLLAEDLTGLPPAVVVSAGYDPLRDQDDAYAERLAASGVAVTHLRYDDLPHMFAQVTLVSERAREATEDVARALGEVLGGATS